MSTITAKFKVHYPNFTLDFDQELPAQGVTVIFGPSGCGKTTVLRCLAGLEHAGQGYIKFRDNLWQDRHQFLPPHQRPAGFVFQDARLFPHLSVKANLEFGMKRAAERNPSLDWNTVVELLELGPHLERKPAGLSTGEQQRVALGRALLTSPQLLLMDEPLANLDARRKEEVLPFLLRLKHECKLPIIYVTHSIKETLQLVDHLVLLEEGRVKASGKAARVLSGTDASRKISSALSGALLETRVVGHELDFGLTRLEFEGQTLYVPHQPVAENNTLRVHLAARDISLVTGTAPAGTSVLNILKGTVAEIRMREEDAYSVDVVVDVGTRIVATITKKSLAHLKLEIGQNVSAHIKALRVTHELDDF